MKKNKNRSEKKQKKRHLQAMDDDEFIKRLKGIVQCNCKVESL